MALSGVCEKCGVPLLVGKEQRWGDNGVLAQASHADHRMIFYESDNIDDLFARVEQMIGVPVEHIVIESKARDVKDYVESMMSPLSRKAGRMLGTNMLVKRLSTTGRAYGYGDISLVSRDKDEEGRETITMSVRNPHSILLFCGESLGAWEAIQGRDHRVEWEKVGEDEYHVTNSPGSHPVELHGMLARRRFPQKPGDVSLDRCPKCGVPEIVGACDWDAVNGTVFDRASGRRMALIGPAGLEAIFDDLTSELGDAIPEAVVEAQRRHVREVMAERSWMGDSPTYREMLAVRGLGNLRTFEADRDRMQVTIENPCLTLMTAGTLQAMFEIGAARQASSCEFEVKDDGDLCLEVKAL